MKQYLTLFFLLIAYSSFSQPGSKPVYVIVHGAWGGSWAFKKVDSLLTAKDCIVYRPSLTGLGERVHLASTEIGLSTHIKDVVNLILYEDLRDVVLVGHSYGGMVITGVADSVPGRIRKLIYLDAYVPENGESMLSIAGSRSDWFRKTNKEGFAVPPWVPAGTLPPKDVPHPFMTFSDPVILKNPRRSIISTIYIHTVSKGKTPSDDDFFIQAEKAKKKGWAVLLFESDHNPQWSAPKALAEVLKNALKK